MAEDKSTRNSATDNDSSIRIVNDMMEDILNGSKNMKLIITNKDDRIQFSAAAPVDINIMESLPPDSIIKDYPSNRKIARTIPVRPEEAIKIIPELLEKITEKQKSETDFYKKEAINDVIEKLNSAQTEAQEMIEIKEHNKGKPIEDSLLGVVIKVTAKQIGQFIAEQSIISSRKDRPTGIPSEGFEPPKTKGQIPTINKER